MAVHILERRFDPHLAAEVVTLENSFGVRHVLTIHIAEHEACPACGRLYQDRRPGTPDVEAAVRAAIAECEAHEKKLRAHARQRKGRT